MNLQIHAELVLLMHFVLVVDNCKSCVHPLKVGCFYSNCILVGFAVESIFHSDC